MPVCLFGHERTFFSRAPLYTRDGPAAASLCARRHARRQAGRQAKASPDWSTLHTTPTREPHKMPLQAPFVVGLGLGMGWVGLGWIETGAPRCGTGEVFWSNFSTPREKVPSTRMRMQDRCACTTTVGALPLATAGGFREVLACTPGCPFTPHRGQEKKRSDRVV